MHRTSCGPAVALSKIPLTEREGYVYNPETKRSNTFEGFLWEYPYRISGDGIDIDIDIDGVILKRADDYHRFVPKDDYGYEEWEKPWVYIHDVVMDQIEDGFGNVWFGSDLLCHDRSTGPDEISLYPKWTPEDTERLNAKLAIDPNQGTFDV